MITTEQIALYDECPRKSGWFQFQPPRLSIGEVLREALTVGLESGKPERAKNHVMLRAANPGLAITTISSVYEIAVHHAYLMETVVQYLLADGGKWDRSPEMKVAGHAYQPDSYLMEDGRLRRVVLASSWSEQRKLEESHSWRTVADSVLTNRPMLINTIVIGPTVNGFRSSVWTRSYEHPVSKKLRIQSRAKETKGRPFSDTWRKRYREQTTVTPKEWLRLMQVDEAFEKVVSSWTVDVPQQPGLLNQVVEMVESVAEGSNEMRRTNCFRLSPCAFSGMCYSNPPSSPMQSGWINKNTPSRL